MRKTLVMVVFPNAKINFGLSIVAKRNDGYHDIESIFYPIGICDALEIEPSTTGTTNLTIHGLSVPGTVNDNLIMKAWLLMQERYNLPEVAINLVKHIPMGGGVGGGSADCGFFINLVDSFFKLNLAIQEKQEIAARLGSDCVFFINNVPALVTGRGEFLKPLAPFLSGYYLVLLYGGVHISTQEAYAGIRPVPASVNLEEVSQGPTENWKRLVKNDFEGVVFKKHPKLEELKTALYNQGAFYASLTGTGSCLYGLFNEKPHLKPALLEHVCWQGYL